MRDSGAAEISDHKCRHAKVVCAMGLNMSTGTPRLKNDAAVECGHLGHTRVPKHTAKIQLWQHFSGSEGAPLLLC